MEFITLIILSFFLQKMALSFIVILVLVIYTIVKSNEIFLQFVINNFSFFFLGAIILFFIWFYSSINEYFLENFDHFPKEDVFNYIIRFIITLLVIIVSLIFSSKLRRTKFKKISAHIISNDLFYPLLFFSTVFIIEKLIDKGLVILHNIHNFLLGKNTLPIDWLFVIYTLIVLFYTFYYISKYIKGNIYDFNSNFDKIAFLILLLFPILILDFFHFTFEFFPILITTSIYLSLKNHNENKKENLDETLQWNSYTQAIQGVTEMISLNTDEILHFATPRGLRYLTEQLNATQDKSISYLIRKLVSEKTKINIETLKSLLNSETYNLDEKIQEIIHLLKEYKIDLDFEHKINSLKLELFKNNNVNFKRFFLVDANTKDELIGNDFVNLLSQETDLTDEIRVFNSVYLLHRLFNIDIYLIPKKEFIKEIKKDKLIKIQKEREKKRIVKNHNEKIDKIECKWCKSIKIMILKIQRDISICYYNHFHPNRNLLINSIKNLGINKILKEKDNNPKCKYYGEKPEKSRSFIFKKIKIELKYKYYRAKPRKNGTFIFEEIQTEKDKKFFEIIIKRFGDDNYDLEKLIEKNKII